MIKKVFLLFILMVSLALLSSCMINLTPYTRDYLYFDTYERITIYTNKGESSLKEYFIYTKNLLEKYHILTNRYEEEKDPYKGIYYLNQHSGEYVKIDDEVIGIIKESIKDYEVGDYFSIGCGAISDIWHDIIDEYNEATNCTKYGDITLPSDDIINAQYEIDQSKIQIADDNTIFIPEGMSLDLGGVVKGYVSKLLIEYYDSLNLKYVIDMGASNIYTNIGNPKRKNNAYLVGLIDPKTVGCETKISSYETIILPLNYSIVTSGDYQKYFTYNGRIYSHILDINTNSPAVTDIRSISILIKDPFIGDIYSTSLFIMGKDKALDFINKKDGIEGIIYTDNGIFMSDGMNEYISQ